MAISILAPLTGRDQSARASRTSMWVFQSSRPLRGATGKLRAGDAWHGISILAPLTGRDGLPEKHSRLHKIFQSSRPLRGATLTRELMTGQ